MRCATSSTSSSSAPCGIGSSKPSVTAGGGFEPEAEAEPLAVDVSRHRGRGAAVAFLESLLDRAEPLPVAAAWAGAEGRSELVGLALGEAWIGRELLTDDVIAALVARAGHRCDQRAQRQGVDARAALPRHRRRRAQPRHRDRRVPHRSRGRHLPTGGSGTALRRRRGAGARRPGGRSARPRRDCRRHRRGHRAPGGRRGPADRAAFAPP